MLNLLGIPESTKVWRGCVTIFIENPGLAIAVIIALGAGAQWIAWRINLPAILPLLLTGFMLGPVFGLFQPTVLFGEDLLFPLVSLAVSLILFEGGMTLQIKELREIGSTVWRLVSVGGLVAWALIAAAGVFIMGLEIELAVLLGALLMVTGPTVIGPLLRIVRPVPHVGNVLKWEGIVIDPIGAMIAALVYTYIIHSRGGGALSQTIITFGLFIVVGSIVGAVAGYLLAYLLRNRSIPDFLVNLAALAFVLVAFSVSNLLVAESGLLATTIMGIIIANTSVPNFRAILSFKEDLTVFVISVLFIMLAANIELETLLSVISWKSLLLLAAIMLVIRPVTIFLSAAGSKFSFNEKLYLSWIGPRGIVAASVSSLFAARLSSAGIAGADTLVPLVFLVIVGTVLLNSLTALPFAKRLGVAEPDPQGFLILGAHPFARAIGTYLQNEGFDVLLSDTNWSNISAARSEGLRTYFGSLLADQADDDVRLSGLGNLLALTSNEEANALTALKYSRFFGTANVYQLIPHHQTGARGSLGEQVGGRKLFNGQANFHDLRTLYDRGAQIKETQMTEEFNLEDYYAAHKNSFIPLFAKANGDLIVLTQEKGIPEKMDKLVSLRVPSGENLLTRRAVQIP